MPEVPIVANDPGPGWAGWMGWRTGGSGADVFVAGSARELHVLQVRRWQAADVAPGPAADVAPGPAADVAPGLTTPVRW